MQFSHRMPKQLLRVSGGNLKPDICVILFWLIKKMFWYTETLNCRIFWLWCQNKQNYKKENVLNLWVILLYNTELSLIELTDQKCFTFFTKCPFIYLFILLFLDVPVFCRHTSLAQCFHGTESSEGLANLSKWTQKELRQKRTENNQVFH